MMRNAVIVASFVYNTANRDEKLPRKPLPKPAAPAGAQHVAAVGTEPQRAQGTRRIDQRLRRSASPRVLIAIRRVVRCGPARAAASCRSRASGTSSSRSTRPRQPERPVVVGDVAGSLMRSRQPKTSCTGSSSRFGSRREQRLEQHVANTWVVGALTQIRAAGEPLNRRQRVDLLRARRRTRAPTRRRAARCRACRKRRPTRAGSPRDRGTAARRVCQCRSQRNTRNPGTPSRASDARTKSGTVPRSSAMISAPALAKHAEQPSRRARPAPASSAGVKNGVAAVPRPAVGAIEADEVIDAVAVVQIGAAARALAQPAEILRARSRPSR